MSVPFLEPAAQNSEVIDDVGSIPRMDRERTDRLGNGFYKPHRCLVRRFEITDWDSRPSFITNSEKMVAAF